MLSIYQCYPWETVVYAQYIVRDNPDVFDAKRLKKHGRQGLSTALIEGCPFMAKAKRNEPKSTNFKPVQWVNVTLADTDALQIEHWDVSNDELFTVLINLVDTGHTVTVKPVPSEDGFMAAAIGSSDDCPNEGLGLSAYADNPRDAVKVLVFKHHAILDRNWPRQAAVAKSRFR